MRALFERERTGLEPATLGVTERRSGTRGDTSRPEGSIKGSIPTAQCRKCKCSRKQKARYAGILQSPLTDSNRRPPPYHGGFALREELRNSACYGVFPAATRFVCQTHPSLKEP
jgi:hypothetical protein